MNINMFRFVSFGRRLSKKSDMRLRLRAQKRSFRVETLEQRTLFAIDSFALLHNAVLPTDVNHDGKTSAADALAIINDLNQNGIQSVAAVSKQMLLGSHAGSISPAASVATPQVVAAAATSTPSGSDPPSLDVNGDGKISAADALNVIHALDQSANPDVTLSLTITDTSGNPITQVVTGQQFVVHEFVKDNTGDGSAGGVADVFNDIAFSAAQADVVSINPAVGPYTAATHGDISVDGEITAVGGDSQDLMTPLGDSQRQVFAITMVAQAPGPLDFQMSYDPTTADEITLYTSTGDVESSAQVQLVNPATIQVVAAPSLTITGSQVNVPATGTTVVPFTVSLSSAAVGTITVPYSTADDTAHAGTDYQAQSGTLTFTTGQTSQTINVVVNGSNVFKPNEDFTITLQAPSGPAQLGSPATATGTLVSTATQPSISISDPAPVTEPASGTAPLNFAVSLSNPSSQAISVVYDTQSDSAAEGTDFQGAHGTLTFAPLQTTATIPVQIIGSLESKPTEKFEVVLSSPTNASGITTATATGTILNDIGPPVVSITGPGSVIEGNSGNTSATFTVSLTNPDSQPVAVSYATSAGSATAGVDYQTTQGTLTFAPGQTSLPVVVNIIGDTAFETNETFFVTLSNPSEGTLSTTAFKATAVIQNDDAMPVLSISPLAPVQAEGAATTTSAVTLTVSLAGSTNLPATVQWTTQDGTATAANNDYQPASGTLTFTPGVTSQTITVNVVGDDINEPDENFKVVLSNPIAATIDPSASTSQITIQNDDLTPTISISNPQPIVDPSSGVTSLAFTVALSAPSGQPDGVSVDYFTLPGTALSGSDATTPGANFVGVIDTLVIPAGQTTGTINVPIIGGSVPDGSTLNFTVHLDDASVVNALMGQDVATGSIIGVEPNVTINSPTAAENAGTVTLNVTLSNVTPAPSVPITVAYTTVDGTALAGTNYTATSGTLTFAPGVTTQPITVPLIDDGKITATNQFTVKLSSATNAQILTDTGTVTETDADTPKVSIDTTSTAPANAGQVTINVKLDQPSMSSPVTVVVSTADGTAKAGTDYTTENTTLTFTGSQTAQTVSVPLIDDGVISGDKTFTVSLSNPTGATIAAGAGTDIVTETESDVPNITVLPVSVNENAGSATVNVNLDQKGIVPLTVTYFTANGSAISGTDYTATSGTVTFAPGVTTLPITIPIIDRGLVSGSPTFTLHLATATNGTIAVGNSLVTILDNDPMPTLTFDATASNNFKVTEGNGGSTTTTPMNFVVTLSKAIPQDVTFNFATASGTATGSTDAAPGTSFFDFNAVNQSVTIKAGTTSTSVEVDIIGDTLAENNETFTAKISNASNATISNGSQTVTATIIDDDPKPTISGFVYEDLNKNGAFDGSDKALAGVTVTLTGIDDQGRATQVMTTTTAADGSYHFNSNLVSAVYTITVSQPSGFTPGVVTAGQGAAQTGSIGTNSIQVVALSGDNLTNFDFGEFVIIGAITKKNFLGENL